MRLEPYRHVFALPGVLRLLLVALLARVPVTAVGITLTLHVVLDLKRGYAAAGAVSALTTIGMALGGPILGRFVDRRGLRPVLLLTTVASMIFWAVAPELPYPMLLPVAFVGGALTLPVFSVVRQSLAALVPDEHRRAAYSIDSMSVEITFMVGPALAVVILTSTSATATMWGLGTAIALAGIGLYAFNPPTRSDEERAAGTPTERHRVLNPRLVTVLAAVAGSTFVLAGTDVGIVAVLRDSDQVSWTGVVIIAWCAASLVGGFVYGALPRPWSPFVIMALLGLLTMPGGLAGHWQWLCLLLVPAGLLCAPAMASSSDIISRMVPAPVRGEAMGWYSSALTTGSSLGAPAVGFVIDRFGSAWGFVLAGAGGAVVALLALLVTQRRPGAPAPTPAPQALAGVGAGAP
ncbi:MFS transporter [Planosporangium mesophilum]|uniref:MFS transporter n=1 Tax=Planosporangium mesophilum TaxID=689768 RepID=A0A8J3TKA9_9ACTN|nr:MFS transporter [Planosporangium mesophilum]NJC84048.1 MFS transporter [Planosporangium mesophilum]GII22950.1 MFS transporter [Planosporangium mesophilum]